jgi:hypothetical protein
MPKRKLTNRERAEKRRRQREYMTTFINGEQKRVKRPPTIDGMSVEDFIVANADPVWLHQNEMWEDMEIYNVQQTQPDAEQNYPADAKESRR